MAQLALERATAKPSSANRLLKSDRVTYNNLCRMEVIGGS